MKLSAVAFLTFGMAMAAPVDQADDKAARALLPSLTLPLTLPSVALPITVPAVTLPSVAVPPISVPTLSGLNKRAQQTSGLPIAVTLPSVALPTIAVPSVALPTLPVVARAAPSSTLPSVDVSTLTTQLANIIKEIQAAGGAGLPATVTTLLTTVLALLQGLGLGI